MPSADVVLITGTTLLNDTLENLLALCRPDARQVVVGPTVGLLPDAFLRRGVDVLGGYGSPRRMRSSTCWPRAAPATISSDPRRKRWVFVRLAASISQAA
jgi:Putative heavy-metal chelation